MINLTSELVSTVSLYIQSLDILSKIFKWTYFVYLIVVKKFEEVSHIALLLQYCVFYVCNLNWPEPVISYDYLYHWLIHLFEWSIFTIEKIYASWIRLKG